MNGLAFLGRGLRAQMERVQGSAPSQSDEETQECSQARGDSPPRRRRRTRARGDSPLHCDVGTMEETRARVDAPPLLSGGLRARGAPPHRDRIQDAMRDFVEECSASRISIDDFETLTVTRSDHSFAQGNSSESMVRFKSTGWRLVNLVSARDEILHCPKNTGFHATSFPSAARIIATGFLRKGGGHSRGFKEAVMARKTIEDAWFSSKNEGVVLELDYYGKVNKYDTASRIATNAGWAWEGWRNRFCRQYGRHIHRREAGDSVLYLNEETVEVTAIWVKSSDDTVESLHRARWEYRNPRR